MAEQKAITGELGKLTIAPQLLPEAARPAFDFLRAAEVVSVELPGGAILVHADGSRAGFEGPVVFRL